MRLDKFLKMSHIIKRRTIANEVADNQRVKVNGSKREPVSNEIMTYFQISGNRIYYTTNDDDFKKMKKDGTAIEKVGNGIELFQIVQNDAYYISRANGNLMALDLKENKERTVIERKLKTF